MKIEAFNQYVDAVCKTFAISKEELFTKSKRRDMVDARHLLYYLCFHRPMQVRYIQEYMGRNDYEVGHSTIIHGIEQVSEKMDMDEDYHRVYKTLS